MIKKFLIRFVLPCSVILLTQQKVTGQFEEGKQDVILTHLDGTAISDGANISTTYAGSGEMNHSIVSIVTLKIDEQSAIFPLSAFTATLDYTVETRATVSPQSALRTDHGQLIVNYNPATGAKYTVRSYQQLLVSETVKITVDHIAVSGQTGSWNPLALLRLENEMRITRYFLMSTAPATLVPAFNAVTDYADALGISWNWSNDLHNNLSQLEWTWVETEMEPFYTYNNVLNTATLFQDNSTRVDLDNGQNNFKIPLLYPGPGKLFYRVRPAVRKNDGTVIPGPWSGVQNFAFSGHEPYLNWQSSTSFAENGKSKTIIQYFDGSLRARQTVTKDNVNGNTIVGETIYDLQGRSNVQILPTPTIDNVIGYFRNFNRFQGQLDGTDPASFFDLTPSSIKCSSAPPLDTTKGNGRYYSHNNDWLSSEAKSANIANAYGYAYTETRFMDDATERVSAQSGTGVNHRIGSGHETKYFYGKPNQRELDAIFGTEVGDATHYSKNMVQDANGQMSVSYIDMHGRTIATALAGKAPDNLDSINNAMDYPRANNLLKNELLTPVNNAIKGTSIESVSTILVPDLTDYHFSYQFNPSIFNKVSPVTNQSVCFDCKYDLEISIRPEDCNAAAPIVKHYNNLQIVPASQACGTPMGFIGDGINVPSQEISFTQSLSAGSWVVRKTLAINDSMFSIRRDSALKVFMVQTQQHLYDSIYAVLSGSTGCGLPAGNTAMCDSCNAHLGTYSQYQANYLLSIGNPPVFDISIIHAQYSDDSIACAESCGHNSNLSTLASLRTQMRSDMMPFTGQYAMDPQNDASGNPTAFSSGSEQAKYNIFSTTPLVPDKTKPFYTYPKTENGVASSYLSDDNSTDNTIYVSPGVLNLSMQDFANRFEPSWANSLLYYHPEFSKLKYAENNLASSYAWQDKLLFTDAYAQAQSLGFLDPVNSDPYFAGNFNISDKTNINRYLTQYVPGRSNSSSSNTPSIWNIANGSVVCAGLADDQRQSCVMGTTRTGLDSRVIFAAEKDKVWQTYKATYLSYRNEMVVNYINTNTTGLGTNAMANLQSEGKQLLFTNVQGAASQAGAGGWWTIINSSDTTHFTDSLNAYIIRTNTGTDKCASQRSIWGGMLTRCEQLTSLLNKHTHSDTVFVNTIIDQILDGMVQVCHQSQTLSQPYGSSTVNPNYAGTPQSFEQVINQVLFANGIVSNIADSNYFCNPFSVEAPKPFGKNAPLFANYTNHIDSCGCSRFVTLKQEAVQAGGYNVSNIASMNQFLRSNYNDTLSLTVWQGLQQCSSLFRDTCSLALALKDPHLIAGPAYAESQINFNSPCTAYTPISLTAFVAMPAFLDCGYQKPCLNCAQIASLTTTFKILYPAYTAVPYINSAATDAETQRNNLWARFLNYRTGFSLSALDYMAATRDCNLDSMSAFIGNGNDCGYQTAVDSLLVNGRQSPYPQTYTARRIIVFQDTFESNDTDEFTAGQDSTLGNCSNIFGIAGTILAINNEYALCASNKPINDISKWEPVDTLPCRRAQTRAQFVAQLLFGKIRDSLVTNFDSLYMARCLGARNIEQFFATYQPSEYHYTLYYYDQAGNLVKTLPPAAVRPNYNPAYLTNVALQRIASTNLLPGNNELLATQYRYNSLNQVVAQHTPDANNSLFWYDRLGRLTISQNAVQAGANTFSYTQYDVLGRITEVGQKPQLVQMTQAICQDPVAFNNWFTSTNTGRKEQITLTVYDIPFTSLAVSTTGGNGLYQQNLRNRVSYAMTFDNQSGMSFLSDGTIGGGRSATYYSYDIHGNVDTLVQDSYVMGYYGNRYKKIVYDYDLISGKVNDVAYQPGQKDGFYHHYNYDAENRLTSVRTSRDKIYWETDATYEYYRHGPLNRTVLGQNQVQGIDYAYTIQGWLKGVNSNNPSNFDIGADGYYASANNLIARDAYGYMLNYFNADFQGIYVRDYSAFARMPTTLPSSETGKNLFNGNISSMLMNVASFSDTYLYGYKYDQLNRLTGMDAFKVLNNSDNSISAASSFQYKENVTYDPNGNIKTYLRDGITGDGNVASMDNLTYQYEKNTAGQLVSNKLRYVHDQVPDGNYSNDLDNQTTLSLSQVQADYAANSSTDNYFYDAIGNPYTDRKAGINNMVWNVYGKLMSIYKNSSNEIDYFYDAAGKRTTKIAANYSQSQELVTYYVRDAAGNVMSVYTHGNAGQNGGHLTQTEIHLYGGSRLGIVNTSIDMQVNSSTTTSNFTRGNKLFELSNHLGNVMATISDKKLAVSNNNGFIDHYNPDIVTATDYYPFGLQMPGRTFSQTDSKYRYGFNGKENDNEVKGEGNQQDYGMRVYDPRLGRFLSVDPLTKKYPYWTPYQFAGNMPIKYIDLDGLEPANNPKDPANQDGRDPTATINSIYNESGGDKSFDKNFKTYMKGTYSSTSTVSGVSNKSGYTSDSKGGADIGNLWVNNTGVFKASDYPNFDTRDFSNFLLGTMKKGVGPENIEFPLNGTVSNYMKGAGIVNDAMNSWYTLNKGRSTLVSGQAEFSGNSHMLGAFISKGMFHPESFVGSATVTITPINDKEVIVKIFNVTSLTSGDPYKALPWNSVPISVVRDPSKPSSTGANRYGNISQTYQFTMPFDASQLKTE